MARKRKNHIYIVGAGYAGRAIAGEIAHKGSVGKVAAFLDDDEHKIGSHIDGITVLGPIDDVARLLKKSPGDEVLIAIPSAPPERLRALYKLFEMAGFTRIRILPALAQMIDDRAHLILTRDMDLQDLLGRTPVHIDLRESLTYLRGKRVLITGAGGSIGSELARQLLAGGAERLFLFGHGENSIYEIERDLKALQSEGIGVRATIVPVIGELQDKEFVSFIVNRLKTDVIFHAAAYKHVPLTERNPVGAIANNIFGTLNLIEAAEQRQVERFVLISTDKVVKPISIYGACKKICEDMVLGRANKDQDFIVVRFGNVLGSRGSIVPLFRSQIAKGGPLTLTSEEARRFFMTIPEAAALVLRAGGLGHGGQLYLLDMGEPIYIRDIAEQMAFFYGFEPRKDIKIEYIGLRDGEKDVETLLDDDEQAGPTEFRAIQRVEQKRPIQHAKLEHTLDNLRHICFHNSERPDIYRNRRLLRQFLHDYVPTLNLQNDEPEY